MCPGSVPGLSIFNSVVEDSHVNIVRYAVVAVCSTALVRILVVESLVDKLFCSKRPAGQNLQVSNNFRHFLLGRLLSVS